MSSAFDAALQELDGFWSISASAGTGKTFSISILWLRLVLEHGHTSDQVLVVTFTNAATFELKERLLATAQAARRMLEGEAVANDAARRGLAAALAAGVSQADAHQRLTRVISDFDLAPISTLHAFCKRLLDDQALELGSDLEAEVVDGHGELIDRLIDDYLMVHADDPGLDPNALRAVGSAVLSTAGVSRAAVLPPPLDELDQDADDARRVLRDLLPETDSKAIADALEQRHGYSNKRTRTKAAEVLARLHGDTPGADFTAAQRRDIEAAAPALAAANDRLRHALGQRRQAALLDWLSARFAVEREAAGALSHDDLQVRLRDALRGPSGVELARSIRQRFRAVLIDECQDCDGVQIEVFQRLFIHNDGNELSTPAQPLTSAFVIGDPKQSIYRFRGADLASYQELVSQAQAAKDMRKNFRSDPDLVRQIDAAYQAGHAAFTPPADVADIPYVAVSAARTEDGLLDPRCSQALPVVWTDAEERTPAKFSIADRLAQECQRLLSDFVSIPDDKGDGEQRRLEAGDIAVLAHNHRDLGLIRRALQDRGIPVQQAGRGLSRLLDSDEARDWRDWMALLAACESGDGRAGAWAAALLANPLGDGSLADEQRLLESLAQSQMELAALRRRGPLPLLEARLAAGCAERVLATHGGERSITNWRHIGAILQQAWSNGQQQAADLLHCLDNPPADLDDALQRLETDRPAVQLVTIHTSKGLEYPVVFCPYLWHVSSLRMSASAKTAVLANEQGRQVLDAGSPAFGQRKKASAQEDRHELERSTYVALTRAVHRCYVGLAPVASSERGHANGAGETPLARLLCGDGDGGVLPIDSWAAHINGTGKALTLGPVNQQQGNDAVRDESTAIQTPDARGLYRAQDLTIERRTSFSSLHSSSDHLDKDRDALADRPAGDDGLLADLGSGANLGNRIHDVLELILGDGISVETALAHDTSVHKGKLQAALDTVLQAALPVGDQPLLQERWGDAPPSLTAFSTQCRCEMPFLFRVDHLDRGRLSQALLSDPAIASDPARRRWAESIARWPFARLQGFCTGSIDLVSCYQGRWYIADYKTNRLTGYERAPCESAMLEKSYLLQSRIYQVALHRHLLRALGTSYEPSRDLGGALYLFLRGWPERGLWFEEADPAAVDALDAALGGQGVRP